MLFDEVSLFLLERDYSSGEKKKIGFVSILYITLIVFLAPRDGNSSILNVDKNDSYEFIYELEIIRTLSWIIYFFLLEEEKKLSDFLSRSLFASCNRSSLN